MNRTRKQDIFTIIAISAVVSLAVSLLFYLTLDRSAVLSGQTPSFSREEITDMIKGIMGKEREDDLLVRDTADRKPLAYTLRDGVKEFHLSAEPIRWTYTEGKTLLAWGYNGEVPGPEIRVTKGDKVRVIFTNNLPRSTVIHWHGLDVPNEQDGVSGLTQEPIKPGETYTYEFTATPEGTHFYHEHSSYRRNGVPKFDMGLAGAFIVEPLGYKKPDKEFTLVLDEWQMMPLTSLRRMFNAAKKETTDMMNMSMMAGSQMSDNLFTINGRAFPDTEQIKVQKGDKVRIRLISASSSGIHPMHLHGHQFKIIAVDGNPVPAGLELTRNTVTLYPGETYDIEFVANNPGEWLFHCHEMRHAGGGMIMPLLYEGFSSQISKH